MQKIETWIRSLLFNIVFLFWTIVPAVLFVWVVLLPQDKLIKILYYWQKSVLWFERKIVKIDYKIVGLENVPRGSCIIAAKHQSVWETCKLIYLFKNPSIVLKKELTYVPVWGWYAVASGLIPIDRKAGVKSLIVMKRAAKKAVEQGRKIVIFPQGTRVKPKVRKPYKVGVAALYQELEIPVVPMAVNSGMFWAKGSFIKKPGTITIEFLQPIEPNLSRSKMMKRLERELELASDKLADSMNA